MYASYIKERTHDYILETEEGFATYRYLEDKKTIYVVDVYVLPKCRLSGHASRMLDTILQEAKKNGFSKLVVTVVPSTKGTAVSIKSVLGYGMKLLSSQNDLIIFGKDF